MLYSKFNKRFFILFLVVMANYSFAQKFTSKECLNASFDTYIKHEGKFFGLLKNELWIKKSQCIIEIKYKNILENKWLIDICREPVHIKLTSKGSQNVYKRVKNCVSGAEEEYCEYRDELLAILQDYGLIFAEGERETLKTSHGQTYCSYLLLQEYLINGILFSKYDSPIDIFGKNVKDTPKKMSNFQNSVNDELKAVDSNLSDPPIEETSISAPKEEAPAVPEVLNSREEIPKF